MNQKLFAHARTVALSSTMPRTLLGCVVVYRKTIVASAACQKKTSPIQSTYNAHRHFRYVPNRYQPPYVHAEISALARLRYKDIDWTKVTLYTYREDLQGDLAPSRPCAACLAYARELGITHICYTTRDGFAEEYLV